MERKYIFTAFNEAKKAFKLNEVPVGAVIVSNNKIIAKAYNKKEKTNDPTAHAEIIAIKKATRKLGDWRLQGCTLFVTLEPCLMCIGAALEARIDKIIYVVERDRKDKVYFYDFLKKAADSELEISITKMLKDFFKNNR
ncbi:MAG: nucleoside deaminase [Bacilli bacterium]|jgi:tRNA(adenine34) deaminase